MKKFTILAFAIVFAIAPTASAMCTWGFVPPSRFYEPLDATEAFLSYDDGRQTVVLVPEFKSSAEDFGIVYPTPGLPRVTEGPKQLFTDLNDLTNPERDFPIMMAVADNLSFAEGAPAAPRVIVVEQKLVGDFDVSVLKATSADALTDWLEDNGYNFSYKDADKFDFYVDKGGFYFVALKINLDEVETDDEGVVSGELEPIQMSFDTEAPQLPMMSLASEMPVMTFDLYTLSSVPYFVPGVMTYYSQKVGELDVDAAPSIEAYDPVGKWLIRQEIKFDPSNISDDLFLRRNIGSNDLIVSDASNPKIFDPHLLRSRAGILKGQWGQIVYLDEDRPTPEPTLIPDGCKVWSDGCNTCSVTPEGVTTTCTLRACVWEGVPECREYFPEWEPPLNIEPRPVTELFTRSLTIGSSGQDVLELQQRLNALGFSVATTGAGSPGNESTYFGNRTKQAVKAFQEANRATVLTPIGLSNGTGYFGPSTMRIINNL